MDRIPILMLALIISTGVFASRQHTTIYFSANHRVKLYVTQKAVGRPYVSQLIVNKGRCSISEATGPVRGQINTGVSANFATFGWHPAYDAQISGTIAHANVKSYADTSVAWSDLANGRCHIKGGEVKLPHVE
jgi:hypothetical protein